MWGALKRAFLKKPGVLKSYAHLVADMHSHVLPGLDDGATSMADSLLLLEALKNLGFSKLCMTPHIMGDFYKNTPDDIKAALANLQIGMASRGINLEISCAAEYYLDEWFLEKLESREELLSFGGDRKFLLIETSYMNEPTQLRQYIFSIQAAGYKPVLAHPERYTYFYGRLNDLLALRELGVLFQLNTNSLSGYYSKQAKDVARQLIHQGAVEFLGSDTHSLRHTKVLERTLAEPLLAQALKLPLLNATL